MTTVESAASLSLPHRTAADGLNTVRSWLRAVAALVLLMVLVGGATRMTGSGLSITEWRPVTGVLLPFGEAAWLAEFEKYRAIPQYELVNRGMSLAAFKVIYAWEWGHRLLGRLIGIAYLLPLAVFWWRGIVRGRLVLALLGIGVLGGLQGAVGWIMVASGLEPGMVAVAPVKLMAHLTLAAVILALLVWMAEGLGARPKSAPGAATALALAGLVLLQIALGALVAGARAGLIHNTWPMMDGVFLPPAADLFAVRPFAENFVDNPTLVQLNHRLGAYLLLALAVWHWLRRRDGGAAAVLLAVAAQAVLGIVTLLLAVPLWAGLAHQAVAMLVLIVVVVDARRRQGGFQAAASA